jgi:hypothetical protein
MGISEMMSQSKGSGHFRQDHQEGIAGLRNTSSFRRQPRGTVPPEEGIELSLTLFRAVACRILPPVSSWALDGAGASVLHQG